MSNREGHLKYDDKKVLLEIYRMRGLTNNQIRDALMGIKTNYARRYMKRLIDSRYVKGIIYGKRVVDCNGKVQNKRLGTMYHLTEEGLSYLEQEGYIMSYTPLLTEDVRKEDNEESKDSYSEHIKNGVYIPRKVKAVRNAFDYDKGKILLNYYTNELYVQITAVGMYMYDSRQWKLKWGVNRNSKARGGFKANDGDLYSLYIIFGQDLINESRKDDKTGTISERYLDSLIKDMDLYKKQGKHIVYVYDINDYEMILEYFKKNDVSAQKLLVIPHFEEVYFGYKMLRSLYDRGAHKKWLESVTNHRLLNLQEKDIAKPFAEYTTWIDGVEYYVVDYTQLNEQAIKMLKKIYMRHVYKAEKKPVLIYVIQGTNEEQIEKMLVSYQDYVKLHCINMNEWLKYTDGLPKVPLIERWKKGKVERTE